MKTIYKISILLFGLLFSINSSAQTGKTEILILGTQHLNQIKDFKPIMIDGVISKLDSLKFDAICIENMPAQLLYDIDSRNESAYTDVLESFGGDRLLLANQAQEHFKINFSDARDEINKILDKDNLTDTDRRSLIKYYVASADFASAVLQFKYLKENPLSKADGFNNVLNDELKKYARVPNEIYSLAIPLAQNRSLQKLEYIDNFQDEAMLLKHFPQFTQDYLDNQDLFKDVQDLPVFQKTGKLLKQGVQANDLLELFVFINSKEFQDQDFQAQWEIWLKTNFPSGADRARYALWEMRNLQIAANIMNTAAFYPGKRILVIIGASHKSFLEKYLRQVPSVKLMEFK